jgi:putative redox protein
MKSNAKLKLETVEGAGLRFGVEVARVRMTMDSGPEATAPSPMQAVLAAVGGCTGMDVISILRKQRQQVTGYELEVSAERSEQHPKVFTSIEVVHRVRGRDLREAGLAEAIRLSDTKYCSVHAMLEGSVKLTSRYEIIPE